MLKIANEKRLQEDIENHKTEITKLNNDAKKHHQSTLQLTEENRSLQIKLQELQNQLTKCTETSQKGIPLWIYEKKLPVTEIALLSADRATLSEEVDILRQQNTKIVEETWKVLSFFRFFLSK
jgi:hypothetical protein